MRSYKTLSQQVFKQGEYCITPIRDEDRYAIMKWRNEQLYHLRQNKPLSKEDQDNYFEKVISNLFEQDQPNQILFSFLKNENCIGYGGLVHINWVDKNAEISFVMETSLEDQNFIKFWQIYLSLIKIVSFKELDLHKIFTYAFDLRSNLYKAIENSGFVKESRLLDHSIFNGKYVDVLIHSCINPIHNLIVRKANIYDIELIYGWVNDDDVRKNALETKKINWVTHKKWFENKMVDSNCLIYIFSNKFNTPVGQVRIERKDDHWLIDFSVDKIFRSLGLGVLIIKKIIKLNKDKTLKAIVKNENIYSLKVFRKLKFTEISKDDNTTSYIFFK